VFQGSDDDEDYMTPDGSQPAAFAPPPVAPLPTTPAAVAPQAVAPVMQAAPPMAPLRPMPLAPAMPMPAAEYNPDVADRGHLLGFGLIASSLGAVAGLRIGGVYGGVAGTLFAGSAVNLYRAALHAARRTPEGEREAVVSATYGLIAAGLGSYISFKTSEWGKEDRPSGRTYAPPLIANKTKGLKGLF
jgi:hypothetical protein